MSKDDKRLIEDYLPIAEISVEAVSEKSARQANISTLHLWWARRPLVAVRAAVYGALVEAPKNENERQSAREFVRALCVHPASERISANAAERVLASHTLRTGSTSAPQVLDLFSGGGAISVEVLRLGGQAYANELNPVAYLINLCTVVFPQLYGSNDIQTSGCSDNGSWHGLTEEIRYWGKSILQNVRNQIADVYPLIPDPSKLAEEAPRTGFWAAHERPADESLIPSAYIWTRAVRCKKPGCSAIVPLARQSWLCRKSGKVSSRFAAVQARWSSESNTMNFAVRDVRTEAELGFDPSVGSRGGETTCPACHSKIDDDYVKSEACAGRFEILLTAIACEPNKGKGKRYLSASSQQEHIGSDHGLIARAARVAAEAGFSLPDEPLEPNPRSFDVQHFGFTHWRDVFTPRQLLAMTSFTAELRKSHDQMISRGYEPDRARAVSSCLSMVLGRLANQCTSLCRWQPEFVAGMLGEAGLPMILDFAETNPLSTSSGSWSNALGYVCDAISALCRLPRSATVVRGSALSTPWPDASFDAIVTDPPYYDSRSYSNLSDHFYVWHKRAVGHLYPEDFASQLTAKKTEAIAAAYRHSGDWKVADSFYEDTMQKAFSEAHRLLKPRAPMICVYAHKTTSGWSTLINAMRKAGFVVAEAWPIEMERKARTNALDTAALSSSILLVSRKREADRCGSYEIDVQPELRKIVRERVDTLWAVGIQGADLVIATVGAGLRAFTRFEKVEFTNGDEVPAETFLAEVEVVVLECILDKLSEDIGKGRYTLSGLDEPSRFYLLWRYTYRWSELEPGEAIVFANGTHVEFEDLSKGPHPLIEKKKGKVRLLDYTERGGDGELGSRLEDGSSSAVIDVLHRLLWLVDHHRSGIPDFLQDARPNLEQLRLTAQALAGPALRGGELDEVATGSELSALAKLTANWRILVEDPSAAPLFQAARQS